MMPSMLRAGLLGLGLAVTSPALAEPAPKAIPKALLPVLAAAEKAMSKDAPARALKALEDWKGPPDAMHALMRGVAHQALDEQDEAEAAFRAALALDPQLKAARVGLARALVAREAWPEAARVLGALVDVDKASAPEVGLYARVAFEQGDLRLATVLVERGLTRFPDDRGFRRLDLALLLERRDWPRAREAARAMLAKTPNDGRVWSQLAAAADRSEPDELVRLATLEAAVLANPKDEALARRHVFAQLAAGHGRAALDALAPRLQARPRDPELLELAARVAEIAGAPEQARAWLERVPREDRTEAMLLLEARLALDAGADKQARAALAQLTKSGRGTSQVYLWAGQLAERAGDLVEAEAAYGQAASAEDGAARTATLYLSRLLTRVGQRARAKDVLTQYVAQHPADAAARALLELVSRPE